MKTVVFKALVVAAALAAGVGAVATMPVGRALSEQERKVKVWGFTVKSCSFCVTGGTPCKSPDSIHEGLVCYTLLLDEEGNVISKFPVDKPLCNGYQGMVISNDQSPTLDVTHLYNDTCIAQNFKCELLNQGKPNEYWGWKYQDMSPNADCGTMSVCFHEKTMTPDKCKNGGFNE